MTHVKIRLFAAIFLFLLSGAQLLNPIQATPEEPELSGKLCALPAPSFFKVTKIGTSWYQAIWESVPGAAAYKITSIDANTGLVINIVTVPGSVNTTIVPGFTHGTQVVPQIVTIDNNGEESPVPFIGDEFGIIVIDLVGSTYMPEPYPHYGQCQVGLGVENGCIIPTSESKMFKVSNLGNSDVGYFFASVGILNQETVMHISPINLQDPPPPSPPYIFDYETPGQRISIKYYATAIATISAYDVVSASGPVISYLYRDQDYDNDMEHLISLLSQVPMDGGGKDRSDFDQIISSGKLAVTPNPFNQLVKVQIPYAVANVDMTISLFDISGQMVMKQEYPVGMPILDLNLELMPAGMYMLRVETGGRVETIKIIKAQ